MSKKTNPKAKNNQAKQKAVAAIADLRKKIEADRAEAEREIATKAVEMAHQIGTEADRVLLKVIKGNGLLPLMTKDGSGKVIEGELAVQASPQLVAALRLGLQRSGRLIEKQEVTNVNRPLREASESELLAELEGRDGADK